MHLPPKSEPKFFFQTSLPSSVSRQATSPSFPTANRSWPSTVGVPFGCGSLPVVKAVDQTSLPSAGLRAVTNTQRWPFLLDAPWLNFIQLAFGTLELPL